MRNYANTCKGICGYNLVYNFFVYFLPFKSSLFCGALSKRILAWEGGTSQTWFLDYNTSSPCDILFELPYIEVWVFRFYKTILNLKTRLQEQNPKKTYFVHFHLNLFICCKNWIENKIYLLQNAFVLQNEFFYRANFF